MDNKEFGSLRQKIQKTQRQMAELLGTSLKAVQSFEQGWRKVPVHIERQLLFLISTKQVMAKEPDPCWDIRSCPPERRELCPAWEFQVGHLCWFVNGTFCQGKTQGSWVKKMKVCRTCEVFSHAMGALDLRRGRRASKARGCKGESGKGGAGNPLESWRKK